MAVLAVLARSARRADGTGPRCAQERRQARGPAGESVQAAVHARPRQERPRITEWPRAQQDECHRRMGTRAGRPAPLMATLSLRVCSSMTLRSHPVVARVSGRRAKPRYVIRRRDGVPSKKGPASALLSSDDMGDFHEDWPRGGCEIFLAASRATGAPRPQASASRSWPSEAASSIHRCRAA